MIEAEAIFWNIMYKLTSSINEDVAKLNASMFCENKASKNMCVMW